jgi:hypothetical protein
VSLHFLSARHDSHDNNRVTDEGYGSRTSLRDGADRLRDDRRCRVSTITEELRLALFNSAHQPPERSPQKELAERAETNKANVLDLVALLADEA